MEGPTARAARSRAGGRPAAERLTRQTGRRDQVVRAVGAGQLEVEAGRAVGHRAPRWRSVGAVGVRGAQDRLGVVGDAATPVDRRRRAIAGGLVPVVLRGRPTVVQHDEWVEARARRHPRSAGVPLARGAGRGRCRGGVQARPSSLREVRRGHPVLVSGLGQRVLAEPGSASARRVDAITGSLTATCVVAGETTVRTPSAGPRAGRRRGPRSTSAWSRGGARQVEPPAAVGACAARRAARRTRRRTRRGGPRATVSKSIPSCERATTVATPRPSGSGRRTR